MFCKSLDKTERIVILVRRLDQGGAQRQLLAIAVGLRLAGWDVHVVLFYPGGVFEKELVSRGIPLHLPGKRGRWDVIGFVVRLATCLRGLRPTVIYSFMDVPNITASVLKPLLRHTRIVWGLRASNMDFSHYGWLSWLASKLEIRLSRFTDRVVANSNAGRLHAIQSGFQADRIVVVPNGIDVDHFRPERDMRQMKRSEFGIDEDVLLVGLIGRLDPMKDHLTFLSAASAVARQRKNVRFICVGGGSRADYAEMLTERGISIGLADRLIWAGARSDMPAIFNSLDVSVSSSAFGEGFSNTIAEAMACGVPCVVTDVGDSALIVGNAGMVVPPRNPSRMADAILEMIDLPEDVRRQMGIAARARISNEFSLVKLVQLTEQALRI